MAQMEYTSSSYNAMTKYDEESPLFLQRVSSGQSQMEESDYTHDDDDSNFSMLQKEEIIIEGLNGLHFGQVNNGGWGKDNGMFFLQGVARTGISIELRLGATFDDLVRLLKKWCLEGPYAPDACVFVCHGRGKEVSISNTIDADAGKWKYLAQIMKECLKQEEKEWALVRMSPMFRYYGDLYPDNGRDSNVAVADGELVWC